MTGSEVPASCYLHECDSRKKKENKKLPQMLGTSVPACKQPLSADGTVEAGHRESTHWHDEGTNSMRERELDEMEFLKCTINTQLSQNLLSNPISNEQSCRFCH